MEGSQEIIRGVKTPLNSIGKREKSAYKPENRFKSLGEVRTYPDSEAHRKYLEGVQKRYHGRENVQLFRERFRNNISV